ncbi:hypothetical protein SAMN05445756_2199 [Kytococcus aerolatus]|uniref:Uncharacterized protein n=2 Tax=Kytococcus aerolatus TaxID=592308 RepID=A0A212U867_9MICO|nr:hypothetical protein SAMN05445756_2199 [Kytococcus aerolatus]
MVAAAVAAAVVTGCEEGGLPGTGEPEVCAIPPNDPWAGLVRDQVQALSVGPMFSPTEAAGFDGIAVVELDGSVEVRDSTAVLDATVVEAVRGVREDDRVTLRYDDLGATGDEISRVLPDGPVLVFWDEHEGLRRVPHDGLWYEVPIMGCDEPVGARLSNPVHDLGSPEGWGPVATLPDLVARLEGGPATSG